MYVEQLASQQHEIWAHWMEYLFYVSEINEDGSATIPPDKVERWIRQMKTPYTELSPRERKIYRERAQKVLQTLINVNMCLLKKESPPHKSS
jgi:hypothetical protein